MCKIFSMGISMKRCLSIWRIHVAENFNIPKYWYRMNFLLSYRILVSWAILWILHFIQYYITYFLVFLGRDYIIVCSLSRLPSRLNMPPLNFLIHFMLFSHLNQDCHKLCPNFDGFHDSHQKIKFTTERSIYAKSIPTDLDRKL